MSRRTWKQLGFGPVVRVAITREARRERQWQRRYDRLAVTTTRLEAFSDGVFAIAITLLVLDLAIGSGPGPGERLIDGWPSYAAYLISFFTIGAAWLGHHAMTSRLAKANSVLLRLNLLVLLTVSLVPFPTALMAGALGNEGDERVYVTVYGLLLLIMRLTGSLTWWYARHAGLLQQGEEVTTESEAADEIGLLPAVIAYVAAIILGLIVPYAAVALYGLIAVALVVPLRELRYLRRSE